MQFFSLKTSFLILVRPVLEVDTDVQKAKQTERQQTSISAVVFIVNKQNALIKGQKLLDWIRPNLMLLQQIYLKYKDVERL